MFYHTITYSTVGVLVNMFTAVILLLIICRLLNQLKKHVALLKSKIVLTKSLSVQIKLRYFDHLAVRLLYITYSYLLIRLLRKLQRQSTKRFVKSVMFGTHTFLWRPSFRSLLGVFLNYIHIPLVSIMEINTLKYRFSEHISGLLWHMCMVCRCRSFAVVCMCTYIPNTLCKLFFAENWSYSTGLTANISKFEYTVQTCVFSSPWWPEGREAIAHECHWSSECTSFFFFLSWGDVETIHFNIW